VGIIDRRIVAVMCIFLLLVAPVNAFSGTIEHDANGNIIKKPGYRFEYNGFNRLSKVYDDTNLIAEYVYDDSGNRIKAVDHINGVTTYSIGREFTRTIDSTGTHDTVYYYHDDVLVGKKDDTGLFFYHPDNLGSTDIVTDEHGQLVEDIEYYPYGETPVAGKSRHQFTGQVKDATGLLYYNARYYDPELRQFTQPDTVLQNIYDPQLLNRYAYARNNPLKYTDPSGHCVWDLCAVEGVIVALAVASIAYWIYSLPENVETVETAMREPTVENVLFAGFAVWDVTTPVGVPEGKIGKRAVKGVKKGVEKGSKAASQIFDAKSISNLAKDSTARAKIAEQAVLGTRGLQHGYDRHAAELGLGFTGRSWKAERVAWTQLNENIIKNPDKIFSNKLGSSDVTGFYKQVDGQDLVTFVYNEGKYNGELASTWRASVHQMEEWGIK